MVNIPTVRCPACLRKIAVETNDAGQVVFAFHYTQHNAKGRFQVCKLSKTPVEGDHARTT